MCCKSNTCLLSQSMIFSLKLQGLFGDKGKSTKQVSLKTIINTRIHVILEILLDSFRMGKKILKEWKGVHMEVKVLQALLTLSQATYIDKILVKYVMQDSKKGFLPFKHRIPLSLNQCAKTLEEKECMELIPYASAVGSLTYLMLCTRPNIFFAVGMVSKYQSNPGPKH